MDRKGKASFKVSAVMVHYIRGGTNMWQEFSTDLTTGISEVMEIIEDLLCYGFEFKVENHKLYFREVA